MSEAAAALGGWMFRRMQWVRGLALGPQEKLVLYTLAAYSNAEGWCWPGVERLARETQLSERIVQYALRILAGLDVVQTLREAGGKSRYFMNEAVRMVDVLDGAAATQRWESLRARLLERQPDHPALRGAWRAPQTRHWGAPSAPVQGALSDIEGCTEERWGVHSATERGAPSAPEVVHEGDQGRGPSEENARAREGGAPSRPRYAELLSSLKKKAKA